MKYLIACLLMILGLGCNGHTLGYVHNSGPVEAMPSTTPVYIDARFPDNQRAAIHTAISNVNMVLNGYQTFEIKSDALDPEAELTSSLIPNGGGLIKQVAATGQGLFILYVTSEDEEPELKANLVTEREDSSTLAYAYLNGHIIGVVSDVIGTRDLVAIAQHEIFHHLGLPHIPIKGTTLYPYYPTGSRCIDMITIQALASLKNWDYHRMNYCIRPL